MATTTETAPQPVEPFPIGDTGVMSDNWLSLIQYDLVRGIAKSKQEYEDQHPEGCHGGSRTAGEKHSGEPFVEYASKRFRPSRNRHTISKYARIGRELVDLPPGLTNHAALNNLTQLQWLSEYPAAEQHDIAQKLASGELQKVRRTDLLANDGQPGRHYGKASAYTAGVPDGGAAAGVIPPAGSGNGRTQAGAVASFSPNGRGSGAQPPESPADETDEQRINRLIDELQGLAKDGDDHDGQAEVNEMLEAVRYRMIKPREATVRWLTPLGPLNVETELDAHGRRCDYQIVESTSRQRAPCLAAKEAALQCRAGA